MLLFQYRAASYPAKVRSRVAKQMAKHSAPQRMTLAAAASLSRCESSPLHSAPWRCDATATDCVVETAALVRHDCDAEGSRQRSALRRLALHCGATLHRASGCVELGLHVNLVPRLTLAAATSTSCSE